jgi:hypothetical protein
MEENAPILWNEDKLNELIRDKIEEHYTLEYKSAGALNRDDKPKTELTKDVSAMANSGGGIIIYGLAEFADEQLKHLPERIDPVDRTEFSKEWIENIILKIHPRIPGIKIHSVQLSSGLDHVAYVVDIPQGNTAHQASDCRYYRRYNFQSVPMPDNEVRDVMNRKSYPSISVSAKFVVYPRPNDDGSAGALIFEIENTSDVLARYVALFVSSPLKVKGFPIFYDNSNVYMDDDGNFGQAYKLALSNHDSAPLFPRAKLKPMFRFKIGQAIVRSTGKEPEKQLDHFRWSVFADSMPKQTGTFAVDDIYHRMQ